MKSFDVKTIPTQSALDADQLEQLLTEAFNKPLAPNYLENLSNFKTAYISGDYDAIAIICELQNTLHYLDKFAVSPEKQGSGIGKALWETVTQNHSPIVWRAAKDNIFNAFYNEQCDDRKETESWSLYIKGSTFETYPELKSTVHNHPASFQSKA